MLISIVSSCVKIFIVLVRIHFKVGVSVKNTVGVSIRILCQGYHRLQRCSEGSNEVHLLFTTFE